VSVVRNRVLRESLEVASDALAAGKLPMSRDWAARVLRAADQVGDKGAKADAYLILARVSWADSHATEALEWSHAALQIAQTHMELPRVASALDLQSCAAAALGQCGEAKAAAERSHLLQCIDGSHARLATTLNYLGVAHAWSNNPAEAFAAFQAAVEFAGDSETPEQRFHPVVNLCILSLLELSSSTGDEHRHQDLTALFDYLEACKKMLLEGCIGVVNPGMTHLMVLSFLATSALANVLRGRQDLAEEHLQACRNRARRVQPHHWAHAFVAWAKAEYAMRYATRQIAQAGWGAMLRAATVGGHQPIGAFAQSRLSHLQAQ
jgi:tetratricopeptide (TPR) repeat protein